MPRSQQLLLALAPAPEPSLDGFFPGPNAAALAAIDDLLAETPREPVLYLFGPAGSGRSHLARGTIAAAAPRGIVAHAFDGAQPTDLPLGPATLLVVEDVERLDDDAQRALVEQFIALRAAGGRFLGTGDRPAAALLLRDDLRTRLGSGVSLELKPLSDEERLAALHAHAAARGMTPTDDLLEYVARRVRRDMGTQVAVLEALDRYSLERKRPLTLPLVREVLQDWEG